MWNFSIAKALGLMIRTAPFLIFRALVYFGIAASLVLAGVLHLAGAMAARWLFFAEAEHVVGLYYGAR